MSGQQEMCGCGAGGNEPSSDHSSWCPLHREYGSPDDAIATINRAMRTLLTAGYQSSDLEWHPPSRPVPVPGQAAREAAVEAVARWLWHAHMGTDLDEVTSRITQAHYRTLAGELLDLPAVAALSAAPGQEQRR